VQWSASGARRRPGFILTDLRFAAEARSGNAPSTPDKTRLQILRQSSQLGSITFLRRTARQVVRGADDSLHSGTRSPPLVVGATNRRPPSVRIVEESSTQPSHANVGCSFLQRHRNSAIAWGPRTSG